MTEEQKEEQIDRTPAEQGEVKVERTEDETGAPLVEQQPQVTIEKREGEALLGKDRVHLPALLSDEFGISQSVAREQIALGMVTIDDELVSDARKLDFDPEELDGKTIVVAGRDSRLSFRMVYDHERHISRKENFR